MENTLNSKLIFFDIDGTLIAEGSNHYVPDSTVKALELLKKNGHICVINTGRPYASLDALIKSIKVDGYVCGCGTYIRMGHEILLAHHLDKELCNKILLELDNCNLEWMVEGEHALYYSEKEYTTRITRDINSIKKSLPENIHCITPRDYANVQFDKFILRTKENSNYERFYSTFKNQLDFIDRGHKMFEVIPKNFSKATGMKFLENYLGIDHKNTIAVGDSSNDISMLEYAQTGILMGGVDESLYKYADYITAPIKEDGIYKAFEHYGLI